MLLCYVDESGDSGTLTLGNNTDTPAYVVCALIVDSACLESLTWDFIQVKQRFYPTMKRQLFLDGILYEAKGESIRKSIRKGAGRNKKQAIGVLDAVSLLLEKYKAKLLAKILVKDFGKSNSDQGIYGSAIIHIARHFQHLLGEELENENGQIIADGRRKIQNLHVSHTIFTQMFRAKGNAYPNIVEMPTFGNPRNHAMLQIVDIVCSAMLFPMVTCSYCSGMQNVHVNANYATIKSRYQQFIKKWQYRYQDQYGWWTGGIIVTDATGGKRNASLLFA